MLKKTFTHLIDFHMKNLNIFLMFPFFLFPKYGVEMLLSVGVC